MGKMGKILAKQGRKIDTNGLKLLLIWASKECPSITPTTVYDPQIWDATGVKLWDAASRYDNSAAELLGPWRALFDALKAQRNSNASEKAQAAPLNSAEPAVKPPCPPFGADNSRGLCGGGGEKRPAFPAAAAAPCTGRLGSERPAAPAIPHSPLSPR